MRAVGGHGSGNMTGDGDGAGKVEKGDTPSLYTSIVRCLDPGSGPSTEAGCGTRFCWEKFWKLLI